jgi:hypothetical protein
VTPRPLLLSEARQAADYLARAEAWVDQVAPELRADIARIRVRLLASSVPEAIPGNLRHEIAVPAGDRHRGI